MLVPSGGTNGRNEATEGNVDDLAGLRAAAEELLSTTAGEAGGPRVQELAKLLGTQSNGVWRDYFADGEPRWLPRVRSADCRTVPHPIRDLYAQVQCDMFMGLFPEIHRAWITIDNRLFLWNYYGDEYTLYDGLDQLIVSVGLVKPRPGVFSDNVRHLLIVSTPVEIVMLKVHFDDPAGAPMSSLELYPTEYNIASDNTPMRCIKGTSTGRIFMAGHDGVLYEYQYERPGMAHSFGFKRHCRKVEVSDSLGMVKWMVPNFIRSFSGEPDPLVDLVVDDERHLLYSISKRGVLMLYSLGPNGRDPPIHVQTVADLTLFAKRFASIPGNRSKCDGLNESHLSRASPVRVVSLQPLSTSESDIIHAVLVSDLGLRLYLGTSKRGVPGSCLEIKHIRGPPAMTEHGAPAPAPSTLTAPSSRRSGPRSFGANANGQQADGGDGARDTGSFRVKAAASTNQLVTLASYHAGVTFFAMAPSEQTGGQIMATSLDLAMRPDSGGVQGSSMLAQGRGLGGFGARAAGGGLNPSNNMVPGSDGSSGERFPPMQWTMDGFHEVVNTNVLAAGPTLHDRFTTLAGGTGANDRHLAMGRVWAIVEETHNPDVTPVQEEVYAHMLDAPGSNDGGRGGAFGAVQTSRSSMTYGGSTASASAAGARNGAGMNGNVTVGQKRSAGAIAGGAGGGRPASLLNPEAVAAIVSARASTLAEMSTQHLLPRRNFLVLTSKGVWSLSKERPVNQLYNLLCSADENRTSAIEEFFHMYGLDEGCAMCLSIACDAGLSGGGLGGDVAQSAPGAGPAQLLAGGPAPVSSADQAVVNRAENLFVRVGYGIIDTQADGARRTLPRFEAANGVTTGRVGGGRQPVAAMLTPGQGAITHSGCFTGLSLCFARLIRPFWDWSVTVPVARGQSAGPASAAATAVRCRWRREQLQMLIAPLQQLRSFLQTRAPFKQVVEDAVRRSDGAPAHRLASWASINQGAGRSSYGIPKPDALAVENAQVVKMFVLLDRTIQALALFDVIAADAEPLERILGRSMDAEQVQVLNKLTWADLVTTEHGVASGCLLLKGLVDCMTLQDSAHVSAKVRQLQMACAMFFSHGDGLHVLARASLDAAGRVAAGGQQRMTLLRAALDQLKSGCREKAAAIRMRESAAALAGGAAGDARSATAMVPVSGTRGGANSGAPAFRRQWYHDLASKYVQEAAVLLTKLDFLPGAVSLALYWASCFATEPVEELPELPLTADSMRISSYELVLELLSRASQGKGGAESSTFKDGMAESLRSTDKLWHFTLYSWLLKNGHKQLLLAANTTYVVAFLEDPEAHQPQSGSRGGIVEGASPSSSYMRTSGRGSSNDHRSNGGEYRHADMHLLLLRDWLVSHERFPEAAALMRRLAVLDVDTEAAGQAGGYEQHRNPTLEQRIEYLNRAHSYARKCGTSGEVVNQVDLAQLRDEQDVANLQLTVFQALQARLNALDRHIGGGAPALRNAGGGASNSLVVPTVDNIESAALTLSTSALATASVQEQRAARARLAEQLDTLWYTLVHPSHLYNDVTYPNELWEECLLIIKVCDSDDPQEVQTLLQNILRGIVSGIREEEWESDRWTTLLKDALVKLGRKFYVPPSAASSHGGGGSVRRNFVFPLEFCVQELETDTLLIQQERTSALAENGQQPVHMQWNSWVVEALREMGVAFVDVYDAYCTYAGRVTMQMGMSSANTGLLMPASGGHGLDTMMTMSAEQHDERSRLYAATALTHVIRLWLEHVTSSQARSEEREELELRIHHSPLPHASEDSVRDRVDQLCVLVGALHGPNVMESERSALANDLQKLGAELDRFGGGVLALY